MNIDPKQALEGLAFLHAHYAKHFGDYKYNLNDENVSCPKCNWQGWLKR